ncbi:MAG: 16S rRNA (adenine(1518)-N(6)/adenine(1519)-N(6))-dimethyltransferase RsmA [Planctomycetota bacterium]
MTVPRNRRAVQALMAAAGLAPRKIRGQNFLVDGNLVDAIVRDAGVGPEHAVLEIGTGTGILTDALADRAGAVVSCDVDAKIQAMTRALRDWPPSVRFLAEDALAGKHALNPVVVEAWRAAGLQPKVVSNLPYSVATPILANLLWSGIAFGDATVLVQKEAAERFTAPVGSPEYGPMSIAVGLLAEASIVRSVPPQVFWPQPKVDSAVLRLELRDAARAAEFRERGLPLLLHDAFLHRRKMLRRTVGVESLKKADIADDVRPEQVDPEAWVRLLTVRDV